MTGTYTICRLMCEMELHHAFMGAFIVLVHISLVELYHACMSAWSQFHLAISQCLVSLPI